MNQQPLTQTINKPTPPRQHGRLVALLLAALVLLGPLAGTALAQQNKVAVCHLNGDGTYIPITIADPALPTHLAHGDLVVGVDVDENCEPLDADGDGIPNDSDNCVNVANPGQEDRYGSAAGDDCEDLDGDDMPDVAEDNFCLSIDGELLISQGTALCDSTATTGTGSNVAVANGDGAEAYAAVAPPIDPTPIPGANNSATAVGDRAVALAGFGNNNSATAIGEDSEVLVFDGDNNSATATGTGARAGADEGDNNTAVASGANAEAYASDGINNRATATGDGAIAVAHFGENNSATSTGVYTCAGAGDSDETAVNEDLCG